MAATWALSPSQREDTIQRVVNSICALSLSKGKEITAEIAHAAAVAIEKKACTAAEVAARTTTGNRPLSETTKGYSRKLAELLFEVVQNQGKVQQDSAVSAGGDSLDLTGSRDFLTKESAEEKLQPLLAEGATLSQIKFSTKSFGRDAAAVAVKALLNVKHSLTDADISDIIAGRPEDEALDALRAISGGLAQAKLKSLNISDNALGEKGVRACAEVLTSQTALEALSIQNVGCSIHACRAVAELVQASGSLRQLHLFNNMSDNEGAQHIAGLLARSPAMADFKMASSRVGPAGGRALSQALTAGRSLVRLDFSDNPMTQGIVNDLITCLQNQPALRFLNLNDTSLTSAGAAKVCQALTQCAPQLEELELALNEITSEGAQAVALVLLSKPGLRKVNLRENEFGDKGAITIARALPSLTALHTLDLVGNQIHRAGAVAVAQAASRHASLQLLALDENEISEQGLDQVREVMESAGKASALGPLDENMEEDTEEEDVEEEGADDFGLSEALAKAGL